MRRQSIGIFLVACAVLAIVGVGFWRARGEGISPRAAALESNPGDATVGVMGVDPVAARAAVLLQLKKLGIDQGRADALSSSVAQALAVYSDPSPDAFVGWLADQNLTLPSELDSGSDRPAAWDKARRGLVAARLDPAKVQIDYRVRGGQMLPPTMAPAAGTFNTLSSRPDRGAGDVDAVAAGTDSIEVTIPGQFRGADGKPMQAQLCLTFVRRPQDGRWIIKGTAFRQVPAGTEMYLPPPV